jgi:hypothetical protein
MANIHADITPTGLGQKELVRLLYHFFAGLEGVAAKLDLTDNTDDTYEAVLDALHSVIIEDDLGNRYQNVIAQSSSIGPVAMIGPKGVSDAALMDILYQLHKAFLTMVTQAVADDLTTGTHLATCWTSKITHQFVNRFGTIVGQGTAYYFRPGGVTDHKQVVEALYNYFYYWNVFCDQLDTDASPNATNFAELWSDTILLRIKNAAGSTMGFTNTRLG